MENFEVVSKLTGGLTNTSFLIKNSDNFYVHKTYPSHTMLFSDMKTEIICLEHFSQHAITPQLIFCDEVKRSTIVSFLNGKSPSEKTMLERVNIPKIVELVRTIHENPLRLTRLFHPQQKICDLYKNLAKEIPYLTDSKIKFIYQDIQQELAAFHFDPHEFVTCHLDLVPGNFILLDSFDWRVIDWEYAANAPRLLEFASIFATVQADSDVEKEFLKQYDRSLDAEKWECFLILKKAMNFYWYLWSEWQSFYNPNMSVYRDFSKFYLSHI